jgi:hypothetical protein
MLLGDGISVLIFLIFTALFAFPSTRALYDSAYSIAPELLSFVKFAVLATGGEILAKRLQEKSYSFKGFGLFPKMIIWGILGVFIYWAFILFANGVPAAFPFLRTIPQPLGKILTAFLTSLFMNLIFSPVLMLTHHLTDRYIIDNFGRFPLRKTDMVSLFRRIDWNRMWGFVFKKTIPFFWIPAHTITFLLPTQYRVLFAAMLSVVLGLLLGVAKTKETIKTSV